MAGLSTSAGPPVVNVYHEKSMILPDVSRVLTCLYEKNVKFETIRASYKDILSLQASRSVPVPFYDGPIFLQETEVSKDQPEIAAREAPVFYEVGFDICGDEPEEEPQGETAEQMCFRPCCMTIFPVEEDK